MGKSLFVGSNVSCEIRSGLLSTTAKSITKGSNSVLWILWRLIHHPCIVEVKYIAFDDSFLLSDRTSLSDGKRDSTWAAPNTFMRE